jgi:hypothetical protein
MPEMQNFDPLGFKRVHDNYRTFDEGAKIGSFSNTNPEMRATPRSIDEAVLRIALRPHGIFGERISDFDKVRFCARRLIQFPTEPLLQAFHNVF